MLSELYYKRKWRIPWIAIFIVITCSVVSLPTYFDNKLYYVFSLTTRPIYWWQYFTGNFEHSIYPAWFFWVHYIGNMTVIVLLGVLLERLLGSKKMLLITIIAGATNSICFQFLNQGIYASGAGVSGIAWAYAPISFYVLLKLYDRNKDVLKKEVLFYIFLFEFFFIWIFITAASSWNGTNRWHAIATLIGIVFLLFWREDIKKQLEVFYNKNDIIKINYTKIDKMLIRVSIIIPLLMLVVMGLYYTNNLEQLYTHEIAISPCHTIEEINDNEGNIEVHFDSAVVEYSETRTTTPGEGLITLDIHYSENQRTMIISFDQNRLEKKTGTIEIINIRLNNGKIVKSVEIFF